MRAHEIAEHVRLERAADVAVVPVHVLQAAVSRRSRGPTPRSVRARLAPRVRQIGEASLPSKHSHSKSKPHDDVQAVAHLVGGVRIRRALDAVDRAIEDVERTPPSCAGNRAWSCGSDPSRTGAAPDQVLPTRTGSRARRATWHPAAASPRRRRRCSARRSRALPRAAC